MFVRGTGKTDRGRCRPTNQDVYATCDRLRLYLVCDGMGGAAGGARAAREAADAVQRLLRARAGDGSPGFSSALGAPTLEGLLRDAVAAACRAVERVARGVPGLEGMGTTLSMLLFTRRTAILAHVGDSRVYRVRDGETAQLTTDHTLAAQLLEAGYPESGARRFGHVLTSAVGAGQITVQTAVHDVLPGDTFLLCTDGLFRELDVPGELTRVLADGDLDDLPELLVDMANARGGGDNLTALVVRTADDQPSDALA